MSLLLLAVLSLRVRLKIILNDLIKNVCKIQLCMVSKLRIIFKRTRSTPPLGLAMQCDTYAGAVAAACHYRALTIQTACVKKSVSQ